MKSAAIALLCVLGGCCTCPPPGLPANIQHALGEHYQAPAEAYQGDVKPLADRIFKRYKLHYRYKSSVAMYGSANYWPARSETRLARKADCKGFAVAAYYDALEAGVPESQLSIWIVALLEDGETHAVLVIGDYVVDRYYDRVSTMAEARHNYANIGRFNHLGQTTEAP